MNSNRKSGKINFLTLGVVAVVGLIVASLFLAREDPSAVGVQFMDALSRRNVDQLTSLSYIGKTDPAGIESARKKLHDQWDFAVNTAGLHYFFTWRVSNSLTSTPTTATVTVMVTKVGPSAYEEKYELPLEKEGDKWKVDAYAISHSMYPGLPEE